MQSPNVRNQFNLSRRKIILVLILFIAILEQPEAQNRSRTNLASYEEQWLHFGFLLGIHSSKYVLKYSDYFISPAMDTVHSIIPGNLGGFKIGFIINMNLSKYLDLRMVIPTVSFYEYDLSYRLTDGSTIRELKDATMVEFPLLLKFKSIRKRNLAMYVLFGINPSIEASGKSDEEDVGQRLELRNWNLAVDVGVGLDIFYPYFKFSPELRYSYGLRNMLKAERNDFSVGLERLTTQNLGLFFTFEGGPRSKRMLRKKAKTNNIGSRNLKKVRNNQKKRLRQ